MWNGHLTRSPVPYNYLKKLEKVRSLKERRHLIFSIIYNEQ